HDADALSGGGCPAGFPGVASAVPFVASAFAGGVLFPGCKARCACARSQLALRGGPSRSRAWRDRLLPWLLVAPSQSLAARVPSLREPGVALSRFPALPVPSPRVIPEWRTASAVEVAPIRHATSSDRRGLRHRTPELRSFLPAGRLSLSDQAAAMSDSARASRESLPRSHSRS